MAIAFCVFLQFGFVVNSGVSEFKGAGSTRDVSLDVDHTGDFCQIASDRGGTAASVHVGHFEADKCCNARIAGRTFGNDSGFVFNGWCCDGCCLPCAANQPQ